MKIRSSVVRALAGALVAGAAIAVSGGALAQQFPVKPMRLILPFAPGGTSSIIGRFVGDKLTEALGQQMIVENKPGGNTIIGSELVAKSPPDGYTLLLVSVAHTINPSLFPTPYDAMKDFAPVATLAVSEQVMVVHPSVPAANFKEFIAYVKARPGQINYASANAGSPTHLAAALVEVAAGLKMQHVPYKGGGSALTDLVGGQVQMYITPAAPAMPFIKAGKLRPLAISGDSRWPQLPDVPTLDEVGMPGVSVRTWFGILAPAGTPSPVVRRYATEIARMQGLSDVKATLAKQGLDPMIMGPEQFTAMMRTEMDRFAKVIKSANIKVEQ